VVFILQLLGKPSMYEVCIEGIYTGFCLFKGFLDSDEALHNIGFLVALEFGRSDGIYKSRHMEFGGINSQFQASKATSREKNQLYA
jgi:hypothetical protein